MKKISLAACLVLALACAKRSQRDGAAGLRVTVGSALQNPGSLSVVVVVTASELPAPLEQTLTLSTGTSAPTWTGTITPLPSGSDYSFQARVFDGTTLVYEGQTSSPVTISTAVTTPVLIVAYQVNPAPGPTETAPEITSIIASTDPIVEGGTLTLAATVNVQGSTPPIVYAWSAVYASSSSTGPAGQFANGDTSDLAVSWVAPSQAGTVDFTFSATDATGASASVTFPIDVSQPSTGGAGVTVETDDPPVITQMISSSYYMNAGDTITLTGAATTDTGTSLSYDWSTGDCNGDFLSANNSTPSDNAPDNVATFFYAGDSASLARGNCPFTFAVTDGLGGVTNGTLTIWIGSPPTVQFAPQITSTTLSSNVDYDQSPVTFSLSAQDINSTPLPLTYSLVSASNITVPTLSQPDDTGFSVVLTPGPCAANTSATFSVSNGIASTPYTVNINTCAPTSCAAIHDADPAHLNGDGIYWINPDQSATGQFQVYCDMTRHQGGWQLATSYGAGTTNMPLTADYCTDTSDCLNRLLDDSYVASAGKFVTFGFSRFTAYGTNYTVRTQVQAADGNGTLHEQYAFYRPSAPGCDLSCASTPWCTQSGDTSPEQTLSFLLANDISSVNTTWLPLSSVWNATVCNEWTQTTFGWQTDAPDACLDSTTLQTVGCAQPPAWIIGSNYPGGITAGASGAGDAMLDGVPQIDHVPGQVWIKAKQVQGSPSQTYSSCAALLSADSALANGVYTITLSNGQPLTTYCDMTNGGWTLLANQVAGQPVANTTSDVNAAGFGDPTQSWRVGEEINTIVPSTAWKMTDASNTIFFRPDCVVDWSISYFGAAQSDCTTAFTDTTFSSEVNGGWNDPSAAGIGINGQCEMRGYQVPDPEQPVIPVGAMSDCAGDLNETVSLWFR